MTSIGFPASLAAASINPVLPLVGVLRLRRRRWVRPVATSPARGFRCGVRLVPVVHVGNVGAGQAHAQVRRRRPAPARNVDQLRQLGGDLHVRLATGRAARSTTRPARRNGQAFASFLLGLPTAGQFDVNTDRDNHAYYAAFFFQDDWRPRSDLTINLGLRYERETGTVERYNRTLVGLRRDVGQRHHGGGAGGLRRQSAARTCRSARSTRLAVRSSRPRRTATSTARQATRSPRDSASPTRRRRSGGKTVFRGGFGIFYDTYGTMGVQQPGFSQIDAVRRDARWLPDAGGDALESVPERDPPARGRGARARPEHRAGLTFTNLDAGAAVLAPLHGGRSAASCKAGLVVEGAYQYSQFRGLPVNLARSYTPAQYLSTSDARDQETINRLTANVPNPFQGLLPGTSLNGPTDQPTSSWCACSRSTPACTVNSVNDGSSEPAHAVGDRAEALLGAACRCSRPTPARS